MQDIKQFVLDKLQETKRTWGVVATESGVPYSTIAKLGGGFVTNPRIETIQALYNYFGKKGKKK